MKPVLALRSSLTPPWSVTSRLPLALPPLSSAAALLAVACGSSHAAAPPPAPAASPAASAPSPPLAGADEPAPALRLPAGVRPVAEAIEMHIDPQRDRFSGTADIDVVLDAPRAVVWLHGKDLHVTRAAVTPEGGVPIDAVWRQREASGIASLTMTGRLAPPGKARVHVEFDAAFLSGQEGLYTAKEAGESYAFTQFEPFAARDAFPCFDEPAFKIPFTTTLVFPADAQGIANTREVSRTRTPDGSSVRVAFAPSLPLPSYLVAFAVGPFDVVPAPDVPADGVRSRPLPLRGVAVRGRGKEMAYALAHTGEILSTLERYVGLEYPWDKLDIVAVPGKGGAMENAGLVTFGEPTLLLDEANAPVRQRRGYAGTMAHELAHQWTGDLVTMQWWDDTWLNEAFATWLGNKAADAWDPKLHADMNLLRGAQAAMNVDALVSARAVRQPIESPHDIENAFDTITYQKGGAVLAMFERFAGADAWQKGLHAYLEEHRLANATADDFLDAENEATGRDVKSAFHTFLEQSGVPLVEASLSCTAATAATAGAKAAVHLKQSRYLPLGSSGDASRTWQIPVCVRTPAGRKCTVLAQPEGDLTLDDASCPKWVMPNADADGYYRFALAPADLAALRKSGLGALSTREKVAYAASVRASYARGTTSLKDAIDAVAPLAREGDPALAEEPMFYLARARDWLYRDDARKNLERYARELYAPAAARLGWEAKKGEDDETRALRASVLGFLATTARDGRVRAEAKKRGLAYIAGGAIHPDAVDPNLALPALSVVGEEADRATWDTMRSLLAKSVDETVRARLLQALSLVRDPALAAAARELTLEPSLRDTEILTPLRVQLGSPDTREAAWTYFEAHFDALVPHTPLHRRATTLVSTGGVFCDAARLQDLDKFFGPRVEALSGGPRVLASMLEQVRLCAAERQAQEPSAKQLFARFR